MDPYYPHQGKEFSLSLSGAYVNRLILLFDINKKYMYSVEHNNAFIALVATSFGRLDHQSNSIQNLKRLFTTSLFKFCFVYITTWNSGVSYSCGVQCLHHYTVNTILEPIVLLGLYAV
jgi:hypothetical protein